jgi:glycosyltransferase involved in cell wall biosynthesis
MKIALVSSSVPFVLGGYRFIVEWLADKLTDAGNQVETVWLPSVDEPTVLFAQMAAFRMVDLDKYDRVITFRPPAHVINHHNKVVWFIHHIRVFYDLWDSPYRSVPDTPYWRSYRSALVAADTNALRESRAVFTNSAAMADRVHRFNNVRGEILYPPVVAPERFRCDNWGDEIVSICRLERHKRQNLLVEAMRYVRSPVRLRLAGDTTDEAFVEELKAMIARFDLFGKVTIDRRWISEDEKVSLLSEALASAYVPIDEDSYGYPTIEAAHAQKLTVAAVDGGGVSEFIHDGENGFLVPPAPEAIAETFDRLWQDRELARRIGRAASARIDQMNIRWSHVVERLLS